MTDYAEMGAAAKEALQAEIQARTSAKEGAAILSKLHKIFAEAQHSQDNLLRINEDAQGFFAKIAELHNATDSQVHLYQQKMTEQLAAATAVFKNQEDANASALHEMQTRGQQQFDTLLAQLQADIKSTNEQFLSDLNAMKTEASVKVDELLQTSSNQIQAKIEELLSNGMGQVSKMSDSMQSLMVDATNQLDGFLNHANGVQQGLVGIESEAQARISNIRSLEAEAANQAEHARQCAIAAAQNIGNGGGSGGGFMEGLGDAIHTGVDIFKTVLPFVLAA